MVDEMTSLRQSFFDRLFERSDINAHLGTLATLASQCLVITEFGVRSGNSTRAFLYGLPMGGQLHSFDINPACAKAVSDVEVSDGCVRRWRFTAADTSKLDGIPPSDLLFIDTLHTFDQITAELEHHVAVSKWIVIHDTELFGRDGEQGQRGINDAIEIFLERNKGWKLRHHFVHCNGLDVLERTAS